MAYPPLVDIVLIASICGLIAISVYSLLLEDKLLSRIEKLEGKVPNTHVEEKKSTSPANIPTLASVNPRTPSENLYVLGKDSDPMNPTSESFSNTLPPITTKFGPVGSNDIDRQEAAISNQKKISRAPKRTASADEDSFEWPQDEF